MKRDAIAAHSGTADAQKLSGRSTRVCFRSNRNTRGYACRWPQTTMPLRWTHLHACLMMVVFSSCDESIDLRTSLSKADRNDADAKDRSAGEVEPNNSLEIAPNEYCQVKGNSTAYEFIQSVKVGSNLIETKNNDGYFKSEIKGELLPQKHSLVLTPGFAGARYPLFWDVWFDLKGDKKFNKSDGEHVYTTASPVLGTITPSGVPVTPSGQRGASTTSISLSTTDFSIFYV
jgi:hypothetical protein